MLYRQGVPGYGGACYETGSDAAVTAVVVVVVVVVVGATCGN